MKKRSRFTVEEKYAIIEEARQPGGNAVPTSMVTHSRRTAAYG